jgi:pyridoxamine 5'-phosphate oxidase
MIRIHTDRRSAKVNELQRDQRAALHFYDAGQKLQLRLSGAATLHTSDDVAAAAWAQSRPMSRAIYGQALPPGTPTGDPAVSPTAIVPDGGTAGFENLMIIRLAVQTLEWLYLGHQGHRRARFTWHGETPQSSWLAP